MMVTLPYFLHGDRSGGCNCRRNAIYFSPNGIGANFRAPNLGRSFGPQGPGRPLLAMSHEPRAE